MRWKDITMTLTNRSSLFDHPYSIFVNVYMQKQVVGSLDMMMQEMAFHRGSVNKRSWLASVLTDLKDGLQKWEGQKWKMHNMTDVLGHKIWLYVHFPSFLHLFIREICLVHMRFLIQLRNDRKQMMVSTSIFLY